ncbi:MAG TPA: hypothetical protein VGL61_10975 [Kofleriaceae bacterium]|jgi:hypothetical protein
MKWLACVVGLASCTSATEPTTPTDFELQIDYHLHPGVTGKYNGFAYAGGETIEVDLVYPDFRTGSLDQTHTFEVEMGSNAATLTIGPACYDPSVNGTPYLEVDDYMVLGWTGSAAPDLEGMGACYYGVDLGDGSDVIGWIS